MRTNLSPKSKPVAVRLGGLSQTLVLATALCGGLATLASAQSENTVTLKYEGGEDITGEFIEEINGMVKIDSSIGLIAVPIEGLSCVGLACPEGTHIELTGDPVTLTAIQGDATLIGYLTEVTDDQYVIATDVGEIKVDIAAVNCEGADCPPQAVSTFEFGGQVTLVGDAGRFEGTLTDLVDGAFVLDSEDMGILRVSTEDFTCEGDGCP